MTPQKFWPDALLFDLDGTLIDSVPDLAGSVNELLSRHQHEALAEGEVRSMIGHGVAKLVERAFAARNVMLKETLLETRTNEMMEFYSGRLTKLTTVMPGSVDLLEWAHEAGVKLAVVTNKPEVATHKIIAHFGWEDMIGAVVGGDTGPTRKPAPDMLFHAVQQLGVAPERAVMVGDSPADITAAINANMRSIAVRGGYTTIPVEQLGANIVINSLAEVPSALQSLTRLQGV